MGGLLHLFDFNQSGMARKIHTHKKNVDGMYYLFLMLFYSLSKGVPYFLDTNPSSTHPPTPGPPPLKNDLVEGPQRLLFPMSGALKLIEYFLSELQWRSFLISRNIWWSIPTITNFKEKIPSQGFKFVLGFFLAHCINNGSVQFFLNLFANFLPWKSNLLIQLLCRPGSSSK